MGVTEDPDIQLRDASLLWVASLLARLLIYYCHYSRGTLLVTFHSQVSTDNVTMASTDGKKVGRRISNNSVEFCLLDGLPHLELMRQLHVKDDVCAIQQQILLRMIAGKARETMNEAEGINLSTFAK